MISILLQSGTYTNNHIESRITNKEIIVEDEGRGHGEYL